jgi:hypothetical protein
MSEPAPYRKLLGPAVGVFSTITLWQGASHVLQVTAWPSGESYRRFFYRDIQAIVVRRSNGRMRTNIVLGIISGLLVAGLGIAAASSGIDTLTDGFAIFCEIVLGICLLWMLLNTLFGPTCTLHIQTAIQFERLPTVRRERGARKLLARLEPLVTAAQADAAAETASAQSPVSQ